MNSGIDKEESPRLRKDTQIYIDGVPQPIIDKSERTDLGDGGDFAETLTIRLKRAHCGHLLRTSQDAGGVTIEGKILCSVCSEQSTCSRCGRLVIAENQRTIKKGDEEMIVCRWCRNGLLLSDWPAWLRWLGAGVVLLLLLKSCA